jgi:hypothetical protein
MKRTLFASILVLAGAFDSAASASTIRITGHCDELPYSSGEPETNQLLHAIFTAALGENSWQICVTNSGNLKEWEVWTYDGTNTYGLMPYEGHFESSRNAPLYGIVSPGSSYHTFIISYVGTVYPWLVFGLRPRDVYDDMPLAWDPPSWLAAYGYRWSAEPSVDGRFLKSFKIVRDSSLDLDEKGEYARLTKYPATVEDFISQRKGLEARRRVPNGFVKAAGTVQEWVDVGGQTIPKITTINRSRWTHDGKALPHYKATVTVDKATMAPGESNPPLLADTAYVHDYRYARKDQTRLFAYAEYIGKGDWKPSNDPELLTQARSYMQHGPKMGDYGFWTRFLNAKPETRRALVWTLLILVQVLGAATLVWKKNKKQ